MDRSTTREIIARMFTNKPEMQRRCLKAFDRGTAEGKQLELKPRQLTYQEAMDAEWCECGPSEWCEH